MRPSRRWTWALVVVAVLLLWGSLAAVLERSSWRPPESPTEDASARADDDRAEDEDDDEDDDEEGDDEDGSEDAEEDDEEDDEPDARDDDQGSDEEGDETENATAAVPPSEARAVAAEVETDPVPHQGDAADDAAIWIDPTDPARSAIVATDKQGALFVYDLAGRRVHELRDGEPNNVDLRDGFRLGGRPVTLVAASDRAGNRIAVYRLDPKSRRLVPAGRTIAAGIDVYGLCLYRSPHSGKLYAFVTSEAGELEQWELFDARGAVDGRRVRAVEIGSQSEGCVADDELGHLYVGEETRGIWKYGAEPSSGSRRSQVDSTDGRLVADVEGLALARTGRGTGYLLASSQGNNTYVAYRREGTNPYVATFRFTTTGDVDGVEDTDGIDVSTTRGPPPFQGGVFVAQDGANDDGNQNFKLVPWASIRTAARPR